MIGVPDALRGQVVKAFVVSRRAPATRPSPSELQDLVRAAPQPARISAPRRVRGRAAQDAGRQGQPQGPARPRSGNRRADVEHDDRSTRSFPEDHRSRASTRCASASASRSTDTVEPWCHEATRDNIRHYAHGIGDDNPLWCDPGLRRRRPASATIDRAAELPVRHQPHRLGLCRRPAGHPRDVGGRGLDLAQDRCAATTRSRPRPG